MHSALCDWLPEKHTFYEILTRWTFKIKPCRLDCGLPSGTYSWKYTELFQCFSVLFQLLQHCWILQQPSSRYTSVPPPSTRADFKSSFHIFNLWCDVASPSLFPSLLRCIRVTTPLRGPPWRWYRRRSKHSGDMKPSFNHFPCRMCPSHPGLCQHLT